MEIQTTKLVYFSPTGTTKAVLQGIARGLDNGPVELIDITKPEVRQQPIQATENDLLVVGVPVYMGRIPALLSDCLHGIKANNTPTVCVVVYGNRAYENALLELKDVLQEQGCVPIAGAAYIGEHSFSSPELPTAQGRPDADDLKHAESFGREIKAKLNAAASADLLSAAPIPGEHPYGGRTEVWTVDFIAVSDDCTQCGICAAGCPMGAIDPEDSRKIDQEKCITCCACIKNCPQKAKSMKPSPVMDAAIRINNLLKEPKTPEFFI